MIRRAISRVMLVVATAVNLWAAVALTDSLAAATVSIGVAALTAGLLIGLELRYRAQRRTRQATTDV